MHLKNLILRGPVSKRISLKLLLKKAIYRAAAASAQQSAKNDGLEMATPHQLYNCDYNFKHICNCDI